MKAVGFLKAIHVVSSMSKQGKPLESLLQYVREVFALDLKAPAHGEALITRVLAQLREHPQT